ncbi:hypothetical protein [Pyxidicoccus xibeiensis]|uniref:hypothetical protein n=1 Tax=Pyxidicoccus xibeiensis TaxID=2906759 RepID=UPI0020A6DC4E|nr:hypothetical protein [Pyxidicoccus xibeiensis]MCP3144198.1 hypothetical protein [Pyxidicoccus xibeiensis]
MLSLVAAVLLAAAPASPSPSLLAPKSGRHLSARLLLAQAPAEAPPDAPVPPPSSGVPTDAELDARIRELATKVALLQSEIRSIDTNWPIGSVVMAYAGYILSPLLLVGIPLIIVGLGESDDDDRSTLVGLGAGLSVGGAVGVGLLVTGIIRGSRVARVNRAHREELIQERIRVEGELSDLKSRRDARSTSPSRRWEPRPTVPLVALRF